jgi:YVTN family beta-propeller protein
VTDEFLSSPIGFGFDLQSLGSGSTNVWTGDIDSGTTLDIKPAFGNILQLDGTISTKDSTPVQVVDFGTAVFNGSFSNVRTLSVFSGTAEVNGILSAAANPFVNTNRTLAGTGTLTWTSTSPAVIRGTIDPGTNAGATAVLTMDSVLFETSGGFSVQLNGTVAGTQYDQLNVNGTVTLAGDLDVVLGTSFTAVGDTFTIITNDGTDAISGIFDGLPEAGLVEYGGNIFEISYLGGTNSNDVVLTTTTTNQFPIGDAQNVTTAEETPVNITLTGSDPDGDPVTFSIETGPAHGTLSGSGANHTYTPSLDYFGGDSFVFRVTDDKGGFSTQTVTIFVTPVNDAPTANDDSYDVDEDGALNITVPGLLANDTDPDGIASSVAPIAVVTNQFANKATTIDLSVEPPVKTAEFSVGSAPLDVAITPDGSRALVTNNSDDTVSVIDLTTTPATVIANIPAGSQPFGVSISTDGTTAVVGHANEQTISILDLTVDPPVVAHTISVGAGLTGQPYDATITDDGSFALVVFNTNSLLDYVLVVDLTLPTPAEIVSARIVVGSSPIFIGVNPDRSLAVVTSTGNTATILDLTAFPFSQKGIVTVGSNPGSKPDISATGLAVVPNSDGDSVSIIDAASATPSVVATLAVGDGPRGAAIIDADNVALIANRNASTITRVNLTDFTFLPTIFGITTANHIAVHEDPGDRLTAILVSGPSNGSLTLDDDGSFSYTPTADYNGTDSFVYKVNDGSLDSNLATVAITVNAINDAPSFTKGPDQNVVQSAGPQTINGWATNVNPGPPTATDEAAQTLAFNTTVTGTTGSLTFSSAPAIDAVTGDLTFTAATGTNGSATIGVTVSDNGGTANGGIDTSAAQQFTITVACSLAVTTLTDGGPGSLREAVVCANATPGADTITLGPGTHVLTIAETAGDSATTGVTWILLMTLLSSVAAPVQR